MISVRLQGKPFDTMAIQAYAPTSDAKEVAVERFCEDFQDLSELTPAKRCPFHSRGWITLTGWKIFKRSGYQTP